MYYRLIYRVVGPIKLLPVTSFDNRKNDEAYFIRIGFYQRPIGKHVLIAIHKSGKMFTLINVGNKLVQQKPVIKLYFWSTHDLIVLPF